MAIIAAFFGMMIRVYHADHPPPHLHVQYGEFQTIVDIKSGKILKGKLPRPLQRILKSWLRKRQKEVMKAWDEAQAMRMPQRVKPLE